MAKRRNYTVDAPAGHLNLREEPSLTAKIMALLPTGSKIKIDPTAETPDEWRALESGGYVMARFLK